MKIAAVIVTCNRKQLLSELLEDLMSQTRRPDGIVVVDNSSEDGSTAFIKEHFPSIQLIELKHNSGLFGGLEIGIKEAMKKEYEAVWLVDDDARLREDTLQQLLNCINSIKSTKARELNFLMSGKF